MTTLHLTNAYHPTSGGIRTFYTALLDAAPAMGRRVVLVVPGPGNDTVDIGPHGRIYYLRAPAAPAFDRRYRLLLPHRYLPGVGESLIDILRRERPDLVEICDKYSLPYLAGLIRRGYVRGVGRPALVGLSAERFDDNMAAFVSTSGVARSFTRWYIRNIYGPPFDVHLANSEYTARELRLALHDRRSDFVRVLPMGVDTDAFGAHHRCVQTRASLLRRSGGTENSVLLFYAGRLSPEKNIGLLVEALGALVHKGDADYRLVIAGDGPSAAWLRGRHDPAVEGRILLCGALDRQTLARVTASADVFVHPNPREPFGIGPLEAMASGVPVVLPNAGGVLEYANRENAWLAAPNAIAFRDAIASASHGNRHRVAQAEGTAQRFRWTEVSRYYFRMYERLAREFGVPRRAEALPYVGHTAEL